MLYKSAANQLIHLEAHVTGKPHGAALHHWYRYVLELLCVDSSFRTFPGRRESAVTAPTKFRCLLCSIELSSFMMTREHDMRMRHSEAFDKNAHTRPIGCFVDGLLFVFSDLPNRAFEALTACPSTILAPSPALSQYAAPHASLLPQMPFDQLQAMKLPPSGSNAPPDSIPDETGLECPNQTSDVFQLSSTSSSDPVMINRSVTAAATSYLAFPFPPPNVAYAACRPITGRTSAFFEDPFSRRLRHSPPLSPLVPLSTPPTLSPPQPPPPPSPLPPPPLPVAPLSTIMKTGPAMPPCALPPSQSAASLPPLPLPPLTTQPPSAVVLSRPHSLPSASRFTDTPTSAAPSSPRPSSRIVLKNPITFALASAEDAPPMSLLLPASSSKPIATERVNTVVESLRSKTARKVELQGHIQLLLASHGDCVRLASDAEVLATHGVSMQKLGADRCFVCTACNALIQGVAQTELHLQGKRHAKSLAAVRHCRDLLDSTSKQWQPLVSYASTQFPPPWEGPLSSSFPPPFLPFPLESPPPETAVGAAMWKPQQDDPGNGCSTCLRDM